MTSIYLIIYLGLLIAFTVVLHLRPTIAVGSPQRVDMIIDVKTISEQGFKGFDAVSWGSLRAPAGTPKDLVDRINSEVQAILSEKNMQGKLLNARAAVNYQTASQMTTGMQQDHTKGGKAVK